MKILVFNAGSSSLKFGVFDMSTEDSRVFKGEFERFKDGQCLLHHRSGGEQGESQTRSEALANVEEAISRVPDILKEFGYNEFDAVGHRVAHGGARFHDATLINDEVLQHIEGCTPLAPLHNPANIKAITISRKLWSEIPQIAVFDTAFHHTIPIGRIPMLFQKNGGIKGLDGMGSMAHLINM